MKLKQVKWLINSGPFSSTAEATKVQTDLANGIAEVRWPSGSGSFTIRPEKKRNGVTPIKADFIRHLSERNWSAEQKMSLGERLHPGKVDAVLPLSGDKAFAVEWETGNISSSHRALNKIAIGMLNGVLHGGALVLPSRNFYQYLTDRVGNYEELEPYFPMWESLPITGLLGIYVVEHDATSTSVPTIPKGTDGRALR